MIRKTFNVLSAISLLLCLAMLAIWGRSYWVENTIFRDAREFTPVNQRTESSVRFSEGRLYFRHIVRTYTNSVLNVVRPPERERRAAPNDMLRLQADGIWGPGTSATATSTVQQNGIIAVTFRAPGVDHFRAQGRTPAQISEVMIDEYRENYIEGQETITITFVDDPNGQRSASVTPGSHWALTTDVPGASRLNWHAFAPNTRGSHWQWNAFAGDVMTGKFRSHRVDDRSLVVPDWAPCAILLIFPGLWMLGRTTRKIHRTVRSYNKRCIGCGYDMRATPGRCPECGTVVS